MRRLSVLLIFSAIALLVASCGKKQLESMYDKQETNIEAIISNLTRSNPDATVELNDGIAKVTVVQGEGAPLSEAGAVAFYYAGYFISGNNLSNSNLFATNYETFANSIKWNVTDTTSFEIMTIRLDESDIVEGLRKGLPGVKGGEECYILFNGKRGFGKKKIANVPSNAALAWHLWIKSVSD